MGPEQTPKQLEDFTQSLRSTFGRKGKVTLGGMGVVALSLAVLFDNLAKQMTSIVRDICPFPNYSPSPVFTNMLSINSSQHLRDHYTAVQSSLTPKQLEDFTQSLRSTFGRKGKVTLGGMGVVALSLAVLFDNLAKQVKGEWVSDSGPIPGLFTRNLRGYYPPQVYTASELIRLLPYIANNPSRMKEEAERYLMRLQSEGEQMKMMSQKNTLPNTDVSSVANLYMTSLFAHELNNYYKHINGTKTFGGPSPDELIPGDKLIFDLNCDPTTADKELLAEVKKLNNTAYVSLEEAEQSAVLLVAVTEYLIEILKHIICKDGFGPPEDFDLKYN